MVVFFFFFQKMIFICS